MFLVVSKGKSKNGSLSNWIRENLGELLYWCERSSLKDIFESVEELRKVSRGSVENFRSMFYIVKNKEVGKDEVKINEKIEDWKSVLYIKWINGGEVNLSEDVKKEFEERKKKDEEKKVKGK